MNAPFQNFLKITDSGRFQAEENNGLLQQDLPHRTGHVFQQEFHLQSGKLGHLGAQCLVFPNIELSGSSNVQNWAPSCQYSSLKGHGVCCTMGDGASQRVLRAVSKRCQRVAFCSLGRAVKGHDARAGSIQLHPDDGQTRSSAPSPFPRRRDRQTPEMLLTTLWCPAEVASLGSNAGCSKGLRNSRPKSCSMARGVSDMGLSADFSHHCKPCQLGWRSSGDRGV